jgi:hypothetical protein
LQFIYKSEEEQKGMAHFVSSLAEAAPRPGPRLIV